MRPVIFNGEMVRALMTCSGCGTITIEIECPKCGSTERLKSQTRRVIRPQPKVITHTDEGSHIEWKGYQFDSINDMVDFCPYGKVGDKLGVRENWTQKGQWIPSQNDETGTDYNNCTWHGTDEIYFQATPHQLPKLPDGYKWRGRPNIHLFKKYARIFLEITGIRVEMLQDITNEDAKAEGVAPENAQCNCDGGAYRNGFCGLWDSINKKRGFGWDMNPWNWALEFKRIAKGDIT